MRIAVRVTVGELTIADPVVTCEVEPDNANQMLAASLRLLADDIETSGGYGRLIADIQATRGG